MTLSHTKSLAEALGKNVFPGLGMASELLEHIAALFVRRTYLSKAQLLTIGDQWKQVFYLHQGLVRIFYTDAKGREFNKSFFYENQLIWPVAPSVRTSQTHFTIAALEDLTVSECSFNRLHAMLKGSGYWEQFALLPYAERFAERLFRREYEFLLYAATERYQAFCREKPHLVQRIPDYHLASYLGMTNVTLSRIKNSPAFNLV